ncbi:carbohydrate ABC transporter permease [Arthrobacter agilis]|uniref:carbohydrate ABC transporter permease n=1 Tax=Arthrobacter agilis TaxID=37921 RepID=UPI000B34B95F|nr:carbohydrate ABC transporter permease [Arthrobacter agilis]OUM40618.1 sugar ABC transporter permease [Arthrobacter agilis]PPB45230.1 carbohydrate ABC transporter permease [Arthrobacter agilis]TPV27933.1 carbohydrate ABC transporter permease [Arthrobacter agilis]VDR31385.1 Inner membrane ABC transporter permease protein ycjP [Arthrobacter agilis]
MAHPVTARGGSATASDGGDGGPAFVPRVKKVSRAQRASSIARLVTAIAVGLVMMFPLYWMITIAFSPSSDVVNRDLNIWPSTWTLENFRTIFDNFPAATWFGNSLVITSIVTVLTVSVNLLAGYAFAKLDFKGKGAVFLLVLSTMMVPVQVLMVAQFRLVTELGIYGTFWAVIFPSAASAFGIFLARQFIIAIPDELMEAAKMDGAGTLRIFFQIVLPLCKPLIAVLMLLTVMYQWNDFAWPLIALKDSQLFTLPIGLLYLRGQYGADYGAIMALALISILPIVVMFLAFQKYFVQGLARSGIR